MIIKEIMEQKLSSFSYETVTIEEGSAQWHEAGKELYIDGRLFDVVSLSRENGKLIAKGLFDDHETWLQEALEKNPSGSHTNNALLQLLQPCLGLVAFESEYLNYIYLTEVIQTQKFTTPLAAQPHQGYISAVFQPPSSASDCI